MIRPVLALMAAVLVFSTASAFGQISIGAPPIEDIKVKIEENGTAQVTHMVAGNATSPVHVELIAGKLENFSVTDEAGKPVQYSTIGQTPMSILLLPTQRNFTLIKYTLPNAVTNDNGVWKWDYHAPSDAVFADFYFPKGLDTIWVLSDDKLKARPVYIADKGLRQMGNGMHLEYILNEPQTIQTVQWQNQTFNVDVSTLASTSPPAFDQSLRTYAFDIDKPKSLVTMIIPKALLWGPYQGKINNDSALTVDFHENDTHAWIGMMPLQNGTIRIIGTTAIPEFPIFVPLVIAVAAVVALGFTNRLGFK